MACLYSSLYILDMGPLSVLCITDFFSQSVSCLFILSVVSFDEQTFLILIKSQFTSLSLYCSPLVFFFFNVILRDPSLTISRVMMIFLIIKICGKISLRDPQRGLPFNAVE